MLLSLRRQKATLEN